MKITTRYSSVESVTYELDEWDIRNAIINQCKIPYHVGRTEFEICEGEGGKHIARMTLIYETPVEASKKELNGE